MSDRAGRRTCSTSGTTDELDPVQARRWRRLHQPRARRDVASERGMAPTARPTSWSPRSRGSRRSYGTATGRRQAARLMRGVRCGLRQLGINRLVTNGIHEHPRVVMTNSMCNSGRDSTRPPGPATDRRRILTRDASTSRLIKPSAGCVCAQAIAAHTRPRDTNLPDRTAEDSHRRATEKIRFKGGAV